MINKRIIKIIAYVLFVATLMFLSVYRYKPLDNLFKGIKEFDKGEHFVFAMLFALFTISLFPKINIWLGLLAFILLSSIVEITQPYLSGGTRTSDINDVYANVIGYSVGLVSTLVFKNLMSLLAPKITK